MRTRKKAEISYLLLKGQGFRNPSIVSILNAPQLLFISLSNFFSLSGSVNNKESIVYEDSYEELSVVDGRRPQPRYRLSPPQCRNTQDVFIYSL